MFHGPSRARSRTRSAHTTALGAHTVHVALDGLAGRRVVPRQRQVRRRATGSAVCSTSPRSSSAAAQECWAPSTVSRRPSTCTSSERTPAVMSTTSGEVVAGPALEDVDPHAQGEVEHHRAVLDEQEAVSGPPVRHAGVRARRCASGEHAVVDASRAGERAVPRRADQRLGRTRGPAQPGGPLDVGVRRGVGRPRHQADAVARRQLAELPPLRRRHDGRAHEPAEARPVGTEDDRHVAGEVDGADGVAGVVDVGRVQPGLAAVRRGPSRGGGRRGGRRCAPS